MHTKIKQKPIFSTMAILLCVLLFCVKLTGAGFHVLAGMTLVIISTFHISKRLKNRKPMSPNLKIAEGMLLLSLLFMVLSGIGIHVLGSFIWIKILHKFSSVIFCIGLIKHILYYRITEKRRKQRVS